MKNAKNLYLALGSTMILFFSCQVSLAQTFKITNSSSDVKVEGTSNVHDWEITAEELQGTMSVEIIDEQLVKIEKLDFTVIAESLKSGKGGMDKNTYKALKTDKFPKITYNLVKVDNIDCTSSSKCKIIAKGYLTIAGTKKSIDLVFDAKINDDEISLTGSTSFKMSTYNVEPPTALFGTITTGDEVKIKFKTVFTK
ncbi:polyisoprenoid-binding protein YceI [Gillisia sp. Hel_I_86]|uniref:YceI family protein n=1 Tax=Gillisia sp. Hel_I_86 TaxID=1249981 RepID=UPI0011995503|nr:YceI family protein [Gillisia sp. Hel_I_86]TVZ25788.1 polyisoprenoid-binding protein YceI [Gillisia sp. Hel_I_86]